MSDEEVKEMQAQLLIWKTEAENAIALAQQYKKQLKDLSEGHTSTYMRLGTEYGKLDDKYEKLVKQNDSLVKQKRQMNVTFHARYESFVEETDQLVTAKTHLQGLLDLTTTQLAGSEAQSESQQETSRETLSALQQELFELRNPPAPPIEVNGTTALSQTLLHVLKWAAIPAGAVGVSVISYHAGTRERKSVSKLLEDPRTRGSRISNVASTQHALTVQVPPPFVEAPRLIPVL
jgi:hypothetical protein